MRAFADALARRLRTRAMEYMDLASNATDPRRDRVITRAIAFSEIADIVLSAANDLEGRRSRADAPVTIVEERAKAIVDAIIEDLCDRRGLRSEWAAIDSDVRAEIMKAWTEIAEREVLNAVGAG